MKRRQGLDVIKVRDVEKPESCMRLTVPMIVLFVTDYRDASTIESTHRWQYRMGGFDDPGMVIITGTCSRLADITDVDHAKTCMPDGGPQLVTDTQRVMQAMPIAFPVRCLTTCQMLARHPPAGDFLRFFRDCKIVDNQYVANETRHLG